MMNKNKKNRVCATVFRRLACLLTAILLVSGLFALAPAANAADQPVLLYKDSYEIQVSVKVTNGAGGWNSAKFELYTKAVNGTDASEEKFDSVDVKNVISSEGSTYNYKKSLGLSFPSKIRIYTDFGGGFTWRKWEADVKIYVNGIVVKAAHLFASSGAFSSADTWHTITIDPTKYPYPETVNVINHNSNIPELPDDDNFFEFTASDYSESASGSVFINACDQYGVRWDDGKISVESLTSGDVCTLTGSGAYDDVSKGKFCTLSGSSGIDHYGRFAVSFASANSLYPTVTKLFEAGFYFTHKLTVFVNDEVVLETFGSRGKVVDLSGSSPVGYTVTKYTIAEGTGRIGENEFVFTKSDAVLTAPGRANVYRVVFDGNAADSGEMNAQGFTYDAPQKLTNNAFKKADNVFVGWNTKKDGSGVAYANRAKVLNLTAEQDAEVTLYAQWRYVGPIVTLVFPDEMDRADEICQTGSGGSVTVEEIIPASDGSGHYRFVSSDLPLDNIFSDQIITLTYEKEDHVFDKEIVIKAPTCTESGVLQKICACGYTEECSLDALTHLYDAPKWTWTDGHKTASAEFTCQRCGDHQSISAAISETEQGENQILCFSAEAVFDGKTWNDEQYMHYSTVQFDLNGGTGSIPSERIPDGEYTLPDLPEDRHKKNCSFSGWMIGDEIHSPGNAVPAGNMTLVAQWQQEASGSGSSFSTGRIMIICGPVLSVAALAFVCVIFVRKKKKENTGS